MKLQIKDVTFGNAVRLQNNKLENFVTTYKTDFDLEYDTEVQLLFVNFQDKETKLVGVTNIKEMTLVKTAGNSSGAKEKTKPKAS